MRVIERPSPIVAADGTLLQSLGIENAGDRFLPLIPSGTRAPASAMLTFATAPERPDEVRFHLLRGTGERPAENHSLGRFRVTNLPPGGPGTPRALLILRVVDGAVQAAAVDPRTGAPLTLDEVAAASGP
jgi:molecular chaperone DnaK